LFITLFVFFSLVVFFSYKILDKVVSFFWNPLVCYEVFLICNIQISWVYLFFLTGKFLTNKSHLFTLMYGVFSSLLKNCDNSTSSHLWIRILFVFCVIYSTKSLLIVIFVPVIKLCFSNSSS